MKLAHICLIGALLILMFLVATGYVLPVVAAVLAELHRLLMVFEGA